MTNSANFTWSLTGPEGAAFTPARPFNASDGSSVSNASLENLFNLPAGAYTLTVEGVGASTGTYQFRLLNLAAAQALTVGTAVALASNPADETNMYQFTAAAGDEDSFQVQNRTGTPFGNLASGGSRWQGCLQHQFLKRVHYEPGRRRNLHAAGGRGAIADTQAGTYALTVNKVGNVPPPALTGTALTLSSVVSGNIVTATQQDHYLFTLACRRFWTSLP